MNKRVSKQERSPNKLVIDILYDAHVDGLTLDIGTKNGSLFEDSAIIYLTDKHVTIIHDCVLKGNERETDIKWEDIDFVKVVG